METTWLEIGDVAIRAPITAGTNLLLAVQCARYARRLVAVQNGHAAWWGRFFAAMAMATAAGMLKHGFPHVLPTDVYEAVLWTSSLAGGLAVYCAQRATIDACATPKSSAWLRRTASLGALLFLMACIASGPEMRTLVAYNAVGLLPVLAVESRAAWWGDVVGVRVASGLMVSVLTGIVYVLELSAGVWFTHIDLAHLLMGVSFFSIVAGAEARREHRLATLGRGAVEVRG